MPDVRLVQYTDFPLDFAIDFVLMSDGTLDDSQALATAVIVALGTDRLALPTDILPDPSDSDRAGWWGDLDAQQIWNGWPIGSRLWLLRRSKMVGPQAFGGATVTLVEQYIREAIQPFIDLGIATSMSVEAWQATRQQINAHVMLFRGPTAAVDLTYQVLWDEIAAIALQNMQPAPALAPPQQVRLLGRR
jgi:phage gp46-like protein